MKVEAEQAFPINCAWQVEYLTVNTVVQYNAQGEVDRVGNDEPFLVGFVVDVHHPFEEGLVNVACEQNDKDYE